MSIQIPLRILVTDPKLLENEEVSEQITILQKQGHEILVDQNLLKYDFITGPNCWYLTPQVAKLFTLAVKNARRVANADQTRVEQQAAKKAATRKPRKPRKASTGGPKAEAPSVTEGPNSPDTGTNPATNSGGTA